MFLKGMDVVQSPSNSTKSYEGCKNVREVLLRVHKAGVYGRFMSLSIHSFSYPPGFTYRPNWYRF